MKKTVYRWMMALLVVGYAGVVGYFYGKQDDLIFPRVVNKVTPPDRSKNPNMDIVQITLPDATLAGLVLPPLRPAPLPTLVIAFGGNAHDVVGFVAFLKNDVFRPDNVAVAGFSYRGYPNAMELPSTGTPTENAVEDDALVIFDEMTARFRPARVMVVGYSLGTAVATSLALHRRVDDLILVAPFTSMADLAKNRYAFLPVDALLKYPFDTLGRLRRLNLAAPRPQLTVVYTDTDGLIPTWQPIALAQAYHGAQLVRLSGRPHGDVLNDPRMPAVLQQALK